MAKGKVPLTVFTPTYNRAHTLRRLYDSLARQSCFDFEWIIIDDGSSDNTEQLITELSQMNNQFPIIYDRQPNGGKHRAINKGVKMANGDWFIILDSDDWLSDNAVAIIKKRIAEVEHNNKFCSITGLRVTPDLKTIGSECDYVKLDSDFFSYRFRRRVKGDRAEVIKTSVMREYPFPEFAKENFLGEAVIWNSMSQNYFTRFTSDKFYICEYQQGGLTDTFDRMMDANPLGAMANQMSITKHKGCPVIYWLIANHYYWHYRKLALLRKNIIPKSLSPTTSMKICSIASPLISIVIQIRAFLRRRK